MKNMRRIVLQFITVLTLCLMIGTTCLAEGTMDTANLEVHKIGVVVYSLQDEQVIAFREYLENYISECFPDVEFVYSGSINDEAAEMEFLQNAIDAGVEGILSFSSYNLEKEVELCAQNHVYYIRAASSETEENFTKVEDNEYFLGCVGPGTEMEYTAGYEMGQFFAEKAENDEFFLLSGGAGYGIEMHVLRTKGILDALADAYGVTFENLDETVRTPAPLILEEGNLKICITPGFLDNPAMAETAKETYEEHPYKQVLSVVPISDLADTVSDARLGVIDCYSTQNLILYTKGTLEYVTGKFSSTIAPSFAAMYNALTGYAADFRENGKAFSLTQGFWTSKDREDYEKKYALSCSVAMNAYSAEDIAMVCKRLNPEATMEDLKALSNAYTYEDALKRRGLTE